MLSFRAEFKKANSERKDVTWYDNPQDDPYDYEWYDEENKTFDAWTEHLDRFHDWILKYFSKGDYFTILFTVNIYEGHDQTQDDILYSVTEMPKDYKHVVKIMKRALGDYTKTIQQDLEFIKYVENRSPLFNRVITLNKNVSKFLASHEISDDENTQFKDDIASLLELPYFLYEAKGLDKVDIVDNKTSLLKGYLKLFNNKNSNTAKKAKDSVLLLINELDKVIRGDLPLSLGLY